MKARPFSIAGLMVAVAACGIGLAAAHRPSRPWFVTTRTLTVVLLLGAALGAFARRGRTRYIWAGFAVFGILAFGPNELFIIRQEFAPEYGLWLSVAPPIGPIAAETDFVRYTYRNRIRNDLGAILFGLIGAAVGALVYREGLTDRGGSADQDHLPPDLS